MKRATLVAMGLILVEPVLLIASASFAQQPLLYRGPGVRMGPMEVHGELSQRATYDSNIFIEPEDEVDDIILVTTPTVNFVLPGERFIGHAFYSVGLRAFVDNDQENSQNHVLSAAMAYRTPRGNFFRLSDTYLDSTDLSTSEEQSNIAPRTRWHDNRVEAVLGMPELPFLERMDFEVGYTFDTRYFDRTENSAEDRYLNELMVRVYYDASPILPKTRWLVEYGMGAVDYDEGELVRRDADYQIVRAGISIEPTAKLTGTATAGVEFREFDFPPAPALGVAEPQELELFNVRANLRYRYGVGREEVGEKGAINLTALREIRESAFRFLERIEPVVEVTRIDLGLQHRLNFAPLTIFANVFYEFDDFPGRVLDPDTGLLDEREDDFFGGSARVRLEGRWPGRRLNLFAEAGYEINDRDSNFNLKDYLSNRASVIVGANF